MFPKEARQIEIKDNSSIKTAMDVAVELHGKYDILIKNKGVLQTLNNLQIE